MTPERWQMIEEIFLAAVEIDDCAERARFLDESCAGDEALKGEVERLIRQDEQTHSPLNRPLVEKSGLHAFSNLIETDPHLGKKIGSYEIVREIGAGGMGAVYLARRVDGSFQKQVAVKIVKPGTDTKFILRRFRQERQILALLNHPFIAALLDGGTTDGGLPYFVMEYIEGEPLYRYADEANLSVRERLGLFVKICRTIEYAHESRVVHRDLKPSNILIKKDGTPRLLDFGIAKVFNPELQGDVTVDPTLTAMRLMTPEYASPEQVKGETVSASSDIYSLGVLLYELLTGHRPYRFPSRAAFEIARVICEENPEKPSAQVIKNDNFVTTGASRTLEDIYRRRGSESLEHLRQQLAGDLERIVLKSLRKKPAERYHSAAAFAADIENYLESRPVTAESFPATRRLSQETAKPNGTEKTSIAILPLAMTGAAGADEEYLGVGLADALVSRLSKLQRFVVRPTSSVVRFAETGDASTAGRELNVRYVLEGNVRRAGERVRVAVRLFDVTDLSIVWAENFDENLTDIFDLEDAITERVAAVLIPKLTGEERRRLAKHPTDSPAAYEAYLRGRYHLYQVAPSEFAKAKTYFEEAVRLDNDYALAYVGLSEYYFVLTAFADVPPVENLNKGREMARRALAIDDSLGEAWAIYAFFSQADLDEVERILDRSVELSPHHSLARVYRSGLYIVQRRFDEAVAEARLAVALNPLSAFEQTHLAWILYQARRFAEAAAAGRKLLADNPHFSLGYGVLSLILAHIGQTDESIETGRRGAALNPNSPTIKCSLAICYAKTGDAEKARQLFVELEAMRKIRPFSPFDVAILHLNLGDRESAFRELQNAVLYRVPQLIWLGSEPELDPIRGDERFLALVRMMETARTAGK